MIEMCQLSPTLLLEAVVEWPSSKAIHQGWGPALHLAQQALSFKTTRVAHPHWAGDVGVALFRYQPQALINEKARLFAKQAAILSYSEKHVVARLLSHPVYQPSLQHLTATIAAVVALRCLLKPNF